jgi:outer membrane receptor protein involved in Fe transport
MMLHKYLWGSGALVTSALLLMSGQVAAQGQSASAAAMLEEIVVTARRREENLQELPMSIQAITSDVMQAQGIYNLEQITDFVPNVTLTEDQRKNDTRLFIRGVGGGFSNPAQVFGVGAYIDGHYLSGSLAAFMSTVDIERVEVLRGPQGTLFGKNTTGGAISLISAKPGADFDSYVTLRVADFGETGLRAMINFPITDNLFFRGNYASEKNDGYYFNRFFNEPSGGTDQQSIGLALRWEVGDNWIIDGRLSLAKDRDDNQGGQCVPRPNQGAYDRLINVRDGGTPANPLPFAGVDRILGTPDDVAGYKGPGPFTGGFGEGAWGGGNDDKSIRSLAKGGIAGGSDLRIDALYPGANVVFLSSCEVDATSGSVYSSYQDAITYSDVDNDMFTLNAQWDSDGAIGPFDSATLQIQGAWRYSSYKYYQDRDFGPGIIDHIGNNPRSNRGVARWTDEFEVIFNGDIGDRLNLTAGVYWFDDLAETGNGTCVNQWLAAWDHNGVNTIPNDPGADGVLGTADDIVHQGTINGKNDDDVVCTPEGGTLFHRLPDSAGDKRSSTNASIVTGESKAIYAHLVYSITDQWDLAVGARYMQDDRTQTHIEYSTVVGSCNHNPNSVTGAANPGELSPLGFCNAKYVMNRSTLVNKGYHASLAGGFSEMTPTFSLTRHLTPGDTIDSGIVYGTISEGYLTGAFNDELNPNSPGFTPQTREKILSLLPYFPEHLTNYELGFKGTMFDGRLQFATAVFFMDYTDKQEAISVDNDEGLFGPDPGLEYTLNAADVEITGIELEMRASPWDGGFISFDIGVLNSDYKNFLIPNLNDITAAPRDASNTDIKNRTPAWTFTASVEHAFLLGNGATLTPQLGVYSQDDYEWGTDVPGDVSPNCHQDSYAKWRFRTTYVPQVGNWQASLFGYNITDEEILYRCGGNRGGSYKTLHQAPSQWGAEFTMNFGGN